MSTEIKRENLHVEVTIKSEEESFAKSYSKAFNKAASKVTVRGFRPGHAPKELVEARVDKASVLQNALIDDANRQFVEAVRKDNIQIYTEPQMKITNVNEKEYEVVVSFYEPPHVELGQYTGLDFDEDVKKVEKKDIEERIEELRKEFAVQQVKEGEAKLGDTTVIDFEGFVDDVAFEGGKGTNYELELGSNKFIPGFEEALIGIKASEHRSINVKFPEQYVKSLAGKDARFEVTCNEVKEKVLPEVDEDFFAELPYKDIKTREDLDAQLEKELAMKNFEAAQNALFEKAMNTILESSKIEIPEPLVEQETKAIEEDDKKKIEQTGMKYEEYLEAHGETEDTMKFSRRIAALNSLRQALVVETICAKENLSVSDERINQELEKIAAQYGMELEQVKKIFAGSKEGIENFRRSLKNQVFFEFIVDKNLKKAEEEKKTSKKAKETKE